MRWTFRSCKRQLLLSGRAAVISSDNTGHVVLVFFSTVDSRFLSCRVVEFPTKNPDRRGSLDVGAELSGAVCLAACRVCSVCRFRKLEQLVRCAPTIHCSIVQRLSRQNEHLLHICVGNRVSHFL